MTGTRKVTREVRYRRSMLSTGSILGCPPSPSPPPSGSESSDGDSSVSASARKPSARASSLETTPDPSDASMDCKSSDFGSTTGKFQRDCKAEEEEEEGKDADDEAEPGPDDLDEPWGYTFQTGDAVWVRASGDKWYIAKVGKNTRKGATRQKEGIFYPAVYRPGKANLRKYFAPLNGEIKPDTPRTRRLLRNAGLL